MLYLNKENFDSLQIDWANTIDVIKKTIHTIADNDFAQPIKPYLRFGDPQNRIIAMPAYVGGSCHTAGIKWIASYPDNIHKNIPRASSVVVLNDADTGEIKAIINTAAISIIRTASVTGFMIKKFSEIKTFDKLNIGIIGFGPIGKNHFDMCCKTLNNKVDNYFIYDLRNIIAKEELQTAAGAANINICRNWQEAYENADIFMCCTAADAPYIDISPKKGSLILNVSLRDFKEETYRFFKDSIIVDDWEEVCRENTIIDTWSQKYGLKADHTYSLIDVLNHNALEKLLDHDSIMFNPMGMAAFDISIADFYYQQALKNEIGIKLD